MALRERRSAPKRQEESRARKNDEKNQGGAGLRSRLFSAKESLPDGEVDTLLPNTLANAQGRVHSIFTREPFRLNCSSMGAAQFRRHRTRRPCLPARAPFFNVVYESRASPVRPTAPHFVAARGALRPRLSCDYPRTS